MKFLFKNMRSYTLLLKANGGLYHFNRISFNMKYAVSAFQRVITTIISNNKLENTFADSDDLINSEKDSKNHNSFLRRFKNVVPKYSFSLNKKKCRFRLKEVRYLASGFIH